jgi:DNA polymerase (family 10)
MRCCASSITPFAPFIPLWLAKGTADETNPSCHGHPSFTILGHATGRLLLKRPGYEIDIDRLIAHAKQNGCFFEINSSPDRLDLSAENARLANVAGVKIAISTDAHSTREFQTIRHGIEQARRAGLEKASVLNCLPLTEFTKLIAR